MLTLRLPMVVEILTVVCDTSVEGGSTTKFYDLVPDLLTKGSVFSLKA